MKPLLCILSILCFLCTTTAQQKKIDSLLAVNASYIQQDSQKVVYLTNIFRQYARLNDLVNMEAYAAKALMLASQLPQTFSKTYVFEKLGRCYHGKAKYLQAIEAYNNGIFIAQKSNHQEDLAGLYLNLGALYGIIPDYQKSLQAHQQAVALYNALGDKDNVSSCYMNMGLIYNDLKNPVKGVEYIEKALAMFKTFEGGLNYGVPLAYQGIANSYLIATNADLVKLNINPQQKYQQSLNNVYSALKVAQKAESAKSLIGPINTDIGNIYQKMGNQAAALQHFETAYEVLKTADDSKDDFGNILYTLGNFYFSAKDYTKSKTYLQQSLAIGAETGLLSLQQNTLEKLSAVFEKTNRLDSALMFYRQSVTIKDSIFNKEKENEITRRQLQLDFSIKENDYKLVQQVSDDKLKQQQLQIIFLGVAIALALIIGGLIYYDHRKTKKLNKIIGEQKAGLEQLGHVKDKLFSVVSHDMRAPVNSLISFIDILEDGNMPPEKLSMYAQELKQNLSHTASLMNNLLNWAASQMQGFKPVLEPFDASALVTEVTNSLQHHLQQKQVTVQNDIAANTIIHADRNMTASILRNLISNAVKFSYKEGVVKITNKNTETGYQLSVTDEGTGMDAVQTAAFNSSHQHQTESKRGTDNEKGTGLGLLLCKTFVQQMGGKISAVKNENGMTFTVWLPYSGF
jgi:signal transduction histidine kinase